MPVVHIGPHVIPAQAKLCRGTLRCGMLQSCEASLTMRDAGLAVIEELFDDKFADDYLFRGRCACGLAGCSICVGRRLA